MQWLGHILRLSDKQLVRQPSGERKMQKIERLVKHAVRVQFDKGMQFNLLQNAPLTVTFKELADLASKRQSWKKLRSRWTAMTSPKKARSGTCSRRTGPHRACKIVPETNITPATKEVKAPTNKCNASASNTWPISWKTPTPKKKKCSKKVVSKKEIEKQKPKGSCPIAWKQPKEKKRKVKGLTDRQRAAEAHAHYIIHHGADLKRHAS